MKDQRFHPEVVRLRSGGTVVWVWADVDRGEQHDPRSSGPCADPGADPAREPQACAPGVFAGRCFDYLADHPGDTLRAPGDYYAVTLAYDAATGQIRKSEGVLSGTPVVGEPPLAQAFRPCPANTGLPAAEGTTVPYHCAIHGRATTGRMRGAIALEA